MKIIFSRKGFDSSSGGVPSPILPDGTLLSLPIPDKKSKIRYSDIRSPSGNSLADIVNSLTKGKIKPHFYAHLDPDTRQSALNRIDGWRPLFGQTGASLGHLLNMNVDAGDLFIFFGLFRKVEVKDKNYIFVKNAPRIHCIWGWMQIESCFNLCELGKLPNWAEYHPHCTREKNAANIIFMSTENLTLPGVKNPGLPGAGVFGKFKSGLQLTDPGARKPSVWKVPDWLYPSPGRTALSHHANPDRWTQNENHTLLQTVGRGQEFVLDCDDYPEAIPWAAKLINGNFSQGA